jgi:hypothetical protein
MSSALACTDPMRRAKGSTSIEHWGRRGGWRHARALALAGRRRLPCGGSGTATSATQPAVQPNSEFSWVSTGSLKPNSEFSSEVSLGSLKFNSDFSEISLGSLKPSSDFNSEVSTGSLKPNSDFGEVSTGSLKFNRLCERHGLQRTVHRGRGRVFVAVAGGAELLVHVLHRRHQLPRGWGVWKEMSVFERRFLFDASRETGRSRHRFTRLTSRTRDVNLSAP